MEFYTEFKLLKKYLSLGFLLISGNLFGAFTSNQVVNNLCLNSNSNLITVTITEAGNNDLGGANGLLYILKCPSGFEFATGQTSTASTNGVTSTSILFESKELIGIGYNDNGSLTGTLSISFKVKAISLGSGNVTKSGGSTVTGINSATPHASLSTESLVSPVVNDISRCGPGNITFTPTGASSYNLYAAATGGSALVSGSTLTYAINNTNTFYVSSISSLFCENPVRTPVTATFYNPISISQHPSNQSICANNSASFFVNASGSTLTYQWQVNPGTGTFSNLINSSEVYGSSTPNLVVTNIPTTSNNYQYRCYIQNVCGNINSNPAILTVSGAPQIGVQPSSQIVCASTSVDFSITTSNVNSYQWSEYNGTSWNTLTNGANYSGVNTSTLHINSASLNLNGFAYRCLLNGICSPSLQSEIASLSIIDPCISISGINTRYCLEDDSTLLTGTPSGGIFSGPGIYFDAPNNYYFNPAKAGIIGTKNIQYNLTLSGCSLSESVATEIKDNCKVIPYNALRLDQSDNRIEILNSLEEIKLYPNPSSLLVTIDLPKEMKGNKITIVNMKGQIVWEGTSLEVSLSEFQKGMYTVLVYGKDKIWKKKLIVE